MRAVLLLLLLLACTNTPELTFGVLSDIHGSVDNLESMLAKMNDVDALIIAGDLSDQGEKLQDVLKKIAETGKKTYVIPGNHETREGYEQALKKVNATNIIDMSKQRTVEFDEFILVSNPYGDDFTYGEESYRGSEYEYNELERLLQQDKEVVLISHQPPKSKGKNCIDVVYSGENVGSEKLDQIIRAEEVKIVISGHIHEAGGRACTEEGEIVKDDEFVEEMRLNPGAVTEWKYLDGETSKGKAAILTIKGHQAKYQIVSI